jgi:hypothetical protein
LRPTGSCTVLFLDRPRTILETNTHAMVAVRSIVPPPPSAMSHQRMRLFFSALEIWNLTTLFYLLDVNEFDLQCIKPKLYRNIYGRGYSTGGAHRVFSLYFMSKTYHSR